MTILERNAPGGRLGAVGPALGMLVLVGGMGFIAGGTDDQIPVAFAVAAVGAFCGLIFIRSRSRAEDVPFLCTIFLLGLGMRCVIALVNHYLLPHGTFALDDGRYNEVGWQLVSYWRGIGAYPNYIAHSDQVGWFYVNGAIYWLWGFVPLVPAFLNCVVGPFTALYVFYLTREIFDRPAAVWASLFAMFFPSMMLWSSINLKDALTTLSIVMVLWHTLMLQRHVSLGRFAALLAFMTLLGTLRSYLFVLTGVSLVGSLMLGRLGLRLRGMSLALLLILGFLAVYQQYGFGRDVVENQGLVTVNDMREELAAGGSAYGFEEQLDSPLAAIAYLPKGMAYFLLAPAPWQIFNLRQALTFPEMLLWYCLLPAIWQGIRYALRERFRPTVTLLTFATVLTVAYAMVETNLGTAYRHRAQVLVVYLIFAALGLVHRRRARSAEGPRAAPSLADNSPPSPAGAGAAL